MKNETGKNESRGQTVFEYVLLLGGVLVLVVLLTLLIRGGIFGPAQNEINTSVATIKGYASALQ